MFTGTRMEESRAMKVYEKYWNFMPGVFPHHRPCRRQLFLTLLLNEQSFQDFIKHLDLDE
jgi:hypothetical protein